MTFGRLGGISVTLTKCPRQSTYEEKRFVGVSTHYRLVGLWGGSTAEWRLIVEQPTYIAAGVTGMYWGIVMWCSNSLRS